MIDVKTRQIITGLKDETGREVQSEKLLEIDFQGGPARPRGQPVRHRAGDRLGLRALSDERRRMPRGERRLASAADSTIIFVRSHSGAARPRTWQTNSFHAVYRLIR